MFYIVLDTLQGLDITVVKYAKDNLFMVKDNLFMVFLNLKITYLWSKITYLWYLVSKYNLFMVFKNKPHQYSNIKGLSKYNYKVKKLLITYVKLSYTCS